MANPISLPSKLRREIVALVKLDFSSRTQTGEDTFTERINRITFEIVDVACSILQGSLPSPELDARLEAAGNEADDIKSSVKGLSLKQEQIILDLERHLQNISMLCQNPVLQEELQHERVPVPSYSHLTETVLFANGQLMAESFRLFLESFGIQSIMGRESAGVVYGLSVGPLGEANVNVTPDNAADARILLDAMQKGYFVLEDESELMDVEMDEDITSEGSSDDPSEDPSIS